MIVFKGHVFYTELDYLEHDDSCDCRRSLSWLAEWKGIRSEINRELTCIEELYGLGQGYSDLTLEEFAVKLGIAAKI